MMNHLFANDINLQSWNGKISYSTETFENISGTQKDEWSMVIHVGIQQIFIKTVLLHPLQSPAAPSTIWMDLDVKDIVVL
jgi:hypothetical protein